MKREGELLGAIADADNLRWAFWKASKGKRAKADCRVFREHLETNLDTLRAECGNVKLVRGKWIESFLREAEAFLEGKNDDQINAASSALSILSTARQILLV